MLKGLGNIASLIKQAQQMGGKLEQLASTLRAQRAEGTAGGGLITVEVNGLGEVLRCTIDPSIAADREMIEDLLPAAANQALGRAKTLHAEAMKSLTQGVDMSGFGDVLAQLSGGEPPGPNP